MDFFSSETKESSEAIESVAILNGTASLFRKRDVSALELYCTHSSQKINRKYVASEIALKRPCVTESLKQRRLAMALKLVFAISVLFVFTYCKAKPENSSETQCKLLPVGEGFASEFRRKANEKGVRLVYLNLKLGNNSYDPLELENEFPPHRWVWTNSITELMLSLPDD